MAHNETLGNEAPGATGRCLCGAVAYALHGPLRDVVNCHCRQCLRSHGTFAAHTRLERDHLELIETRGLAWYQSSDFARRGFCKVCGSSLFWERLEGTAIAVAAGSIDPPTGLATTCHIFTDHKGDYYEIRDGLETFPEGQDDTPATGNDGKGVAP